MSAQTRRLLLALAVLVVLLLLVGAGPLPDASAPPDWLDRLALNTIRHVLPVIYWAGGIVILAGYEVLRWQRNDPETAAATWNRRLKLSLAVMLLLLAVGETVLKEWRLVGYAAAFLVFTGVIFAFGIALVTTYVAPVVRCWNGRCDVVPPPLTGGVLPTPPPQEPWDGVSERRSGKDRRKGARTA